MKVYWCSKCGVGVDKSTRQARRQTRGWVCPDCGTGLPRKPISVILEDEAVQEALIATLRQG